MEHFSPRSKYVSAATIINKAGEVETHLQLEEEERNGKGKFCIVNSATIVAFYLSVPEEN